MNKDLKEKLTIRLENARTQVKPRYGKNLGKLKLQLKLNKDEALFFRNFMEMAKPPNESDDRFIKTIFIMGLGAMRDYMENEAQKFIKENPEEAKAMIQKAAAEAGEDEISQEEFAKLLEEVNSEQEEDEVLPDSESGNDKSNQELPPAL